jgi:hypothetical protein
VGLVDLRLLTLPGATGLVGAETLLAIFFEGALLSGMVGSATSETAGLWYMDLCATKQTKDAIPVYLLYF